MKLLSSVLTATAIWFSTGLAMAQDIKVGFNTDLSASASAEYSKNALVGFQLAFDEINQKGGVLGRKLTLVVRDDLSQPPKAIQNMSDLIDNEKVIAVFGPTNSGNALAWKHIANQKKVPVLTSLGTATDIVKPMSPGSENYMFRVSATDREQMRSLMTYVKNNGKSKNIGFFVDTTGYGQAGLRDLTELAALFGLKPTLVEKLGPNDTDMTSQLNKFKAAGVDTLFVWALGTPIGHVVRSMEKIDYFPITVTGWASDSKGFYEVAGPKLAGIPLFMRSAAPEQSERMQELYRRVESKMSGQSFWALVQAYDTALLLAAAVEQAGSTEGPAIKAALEDLKKPVTGYLKVYDKPFSKTQREGLGGADFLWSRWRDGKVIIYSDDVIQKLKPSDFIQG
jgi:branched-chain amino acid transport system substrate-binding protein